MAARLKRVRHGRPGVQRGQKYVGILVYGERVLATIARRDETQLMEVSVKLRTLILGSAWSWVPSS